MKLRIPLALVTISVAVSVVISSTVSAQTSRTAPTGFSTVRGNHTFYHWFSAPGRVLQVVDNSNTTPITGIKEIAFRRADSAFSFATAGVSDVEVTMSHANWRVLDVEFDKNHHAGTTVVHKSKRINVPDWRARPTNLAFDFAIKFDAPWNYRGKNAASTPSLVWTLRYSKSTAGLHHMDRYAGLMLYSTGRAIGSGCANYSHFIRIANSGRYHATTGIHVQVGATSGPKSSPTLLFLDAKDQNLAVRGLCAKLHAAAIFTLPFGVLDAAGNMSHKYVTFPHDPGLEGVTLYTQLVSLDTSQAGLPFAVSDARVLSIPRNQATSGVAACTLWAEGAQSKTADRNAINFGSAPIALLRW